MERYGLRNSCMIELFVRYILNNMALPFTIRAFYRYMKSSGFSISTSSIHNLTKIISDSYLAFFIEKYDVSYKIMQVNPKKVYIVDNSYIALSTKEENKGKLLENAVYMHL
jgi:predicted AAA+ superfamily ATPase